MRQVSGSDLLKNSALQPLPYGRSSVAGKHTILFLSRARQQAVLLRPALMWSIL
jgi:hypothetical protein